MTSKNLSNKKNPVRAGLGQYHWLALMSFVLIGFTSTVPIAMLILDKYHGSRNINASNYLLENGFLYTITILIATVTAVALFKYLNSKPEVDMFHSLPIKLEHIFLSRYVIGILYFMIPCLIHFILSYIMAFVGVLTHVPTVSVLCAEFWYVQFMYIGVYSFLCLGTIVTGNSFMAVCTGIGLTQAPTALVAVWVSLCDSFLKYYPGYSTLVITVAQYTNPIASNHLSSLEQRPSIWYLVIQSGVMFGASFYTFIRRPSENASNPVALEPFKLIIKSLGVLCGSSMGGVIFIAVLRTNVVNFLCGSLLFAVILHIAFEMLFEMDIRAGLRNKKHLVCLYTLMAGVAIGISLDLVNYDGRLAERDTIASIQLGDILLESPENIQIVHSMIERTLTGGERPEDSVSMRDTVQVNLTNNRTYHRLYDALFLSDEEALQLYSSEEFFLQSHNYNLLDEDLGNLAVNMWYDTVGDRYYDVSVIFNSFDYQYIRYEEFLYLYDLILEQIDQLTPDYLNQNYPVLYLSCRGDDRKMYKIPVYECHETVLDYLEVPEISLERYETWTLMDAYRTVLLSELHPQLQQDILDVMVPIHESWTSNRYVSMGNKDVVTISANYYPMGYILESEYERILSQYS